MSINSSNIRLWEIPSCICSLRDTKSLTELMQYVQPFISAIIKKRNLQIILSFIHSFVFFICCICKLNKIVFWCQKNRFYLIYFRGLNGISCLPCFLRFDDYDVSHFSYACAKACLCVCEKADMALATISHPLVQNYRSMNEPEMPQTPAPH